MPAFRDIDVAEELALGETNEMISPKDLVGRLAARRDSIDEGI